MPTTYKSPDCAENRKYVFRPLKERSLTFQVCAKSNINICLSPSSSEVPHQQYEIFIGGWEGHESAIRRNKSKDVQKVQTPNILNQSQFRGFWIVITDHVIKVGRQGQGTHFLMHSDACAKINVAYYGYCTAYGSTGQWTFGDDVDNQVFNLHPLGYALDTACTPMKRSAILTQQSPASVMYPYIPSPVTVHYPSATVQPTPSYCPQPTPSYYPQPTPSCPAVSDPVTPMDRGIGLKWLPSRCVSLCPSPVLAATGAYVALARHQGDLIPGVVVEPNFKICVITMHGQVFSKTDFYLLSNTGNLDLVWEKGTNGSIPLGAIQGGISEGRCPLYIGRISVSSVVYCGKVDPSRAVCFAACNGIETSLWTYEVLCLKSVPTSLLGL